MTRVAARHPFTALKSAHQLRVAQFMHNAGQALPSSVTWPDRKVRKRCARLIIEEALETINALGFLVSFDQLEPEHEAKPFLWPTSESHDLSAVLDGCADLRVITTATLSALGVPDEPLQQLVDQNNLSKFGPGSYARADGEWMKPPDWQPPDIQGLVIELQEKLSTQINRN